MNNPPFETTGIPNSGWRKGGVCKVTSDGVGGNERERTVRVIDKFDCCFEVIRVIVEQLSDVGASFLG